MVDTDFPIQADGVTKERKHTDSGCCFLFVAVAAGMAALAALGFIEGDVRHLTHGRDYNGRLCGVDEGVENTPFLYYCGGSHWDGDYPKQLNYKSRSCVAKCPTNSAGKINCLLTEFVNTTVLPGTFIEASKITITETMNVEVTQSVAYQPSYPTEEYLGRYCVPQPTVNNSLYTEVVNGPLKRIAQFNSIVDSFVQAWPVVLGAAVLAILLGVSYLYVLKYYAGLLLYISLWLGTILMFSFGLFFLFGLFPDPYDELGTYQQLSPIFVICYGQEARLMSALVGLLSLAMAVCMLFSTLNENIDESIGVITASVDCLLGHGSGIAFVIQPVLQALVVTTLFVVLAYGYMCIASVTDLDRNLISMNGHFIPSSQAQPLEVKEKRQWYWSLAMNFYVFGFVWVLITVSAIMHFVISYAVVDWFFVPSKTMDNPNATPLSEPLKQAIQNKGKRVDGVRVKGVDKALGPRSGYIENGPHGKVLVVPIGQKGPDGRDFIRYDEKITVKHIHWCAMTNGITVCLWYHLGTMAVAGVVNLVTGPLRGLSEMMKTFMGTGQSSSNDLRSSLDVEDRTPGGLAAAGVGLLATILDEVFGRYSKNMYVDIVLRSSDFTLAANDAYDFIADAGGAVALLHGGTGSYELIGVVIITAICSLSTHIALTKISYFAVPETPHYVSDPAMMTLLAACLSCTIASGFMSLFNMTADSLLYTFAWSRKHHSDKIKDFCPTALLHIMGKELEEAPALALQPHPRNRMTRYSHYASRYKDTVMATMATYRGGTEARPLLGTGGWSSRR